MKRFLLEVIVQSLADAREAARGGADRLEVVRAIHDGGLTPPLALVSRIAAEVSLPLRVMVRENAGYTTTGSERPVLRHAVASLAGAGVHGLVIGFADGGEPGLADLRDALQGTPAVRVTFHRAFDQLHDPLAAIDLLGTIPAVDRILTSGGDGTPAARCARLHEYAARAGTRITIVAGGGVDDEMLTELVRVRPLDEVHVGRLAREGADPAGPVSAARVERIRDRLERAG